MKAYNFEKVQTQIDQIEKDLLSCGDVTEDHLEELWLACHRVLDTHQEYLRVLIGMWEDQFDEETIINNLRGQN